MSDSFRAWIRGILDGQLRVPKGLRRQVIDTVSREYAQRQRRRSIPTAIALALFVLLVGSLFFGLRMSRFPGTAGPASSLQPATSPSATLTPSATSSPNGCMAASETASGCLTVTPNAGPVGTVVVLEGTGCSYTGRTAYLVFEGEGGSETGTVGAIDIPNVPVDASGHLRLTFTIPSSLHPLHSQGGGLTVPGTYDLASKPAGLCYAPFTVTAS